MGLQPIGREVSENISAGRTGRMPMFRLILREGERENHAAIDKSDSIQTAPAKNTSRGPIDLIAKDVRDRDPKQTGNNQQISENRY